MVSSPAPKGKAGRPAPRAKGRRAGRPLGGVPPHPGRRRIGSGFRFALAGLAQNRARHSNQRTEEARAQLAFKQAPAGPPAWSRQCLALTVGVGVVKALASRQGNVNPSATNRQPNSRNRRPIAATIAPCHRRSEVQTSCSSGNPGPATLLRIKCPRLPRLFEIPEPPSWPQRRPGDADGRCGCRAVGVTTPPAGASVAATSPNKSSGLTTPAGPFRATWASTMVVSRFSCPSNS